ncbi:MAG TPA: hypothetical protein VHD90_21150, partial [Phototrophicaceae bacterium]|nr:hypothetical protein [Phototrophicaceae bacterium]
ASQLNVIAPNHHSTILGLCTFCLVMAVMLFALALGAPVNEFREHNRKVIDNFVRRMFKK